MEMKEIKKAESMLKEKEAEKAKRISQADKEIKSVEEKLTSLRAKLEKAETAEAFAATCHEITDAEAALKFFNKKKADVQSDAILTAEEYSAIKKEIQSAYDKFTAESAESIRAELDKAIMQLNVFESTIGELNHVLAKAAAIRGESPSVLSSKVVLANKDPLDVHKAMIDGYFRMIGAKMSYNHSATGGNV